MFAPSAAASRTNRSAFFCGRCQSRVCSAVGLTPWCQARALSTFVAIQRDHRLMSLD